MPKHELYIHLRCSSSACVIESSTLKTKFLKIFHLIMTVSCQSDHENKSKLNKDMPSPPRQIRGPEHIK